MNSPRLHLADTLDSLPPEWPDDPLPAIQSAIRETRQKVAVLDDDPTGAQTVHDLPELTDWSVEMLVEELQNDLPTFYILTNARAMPVSQAMALNAEISRNLLQASLHTGREPVIVNRSDSTLRGHFPEELDAIVEATGQNFDAWIFIPFFFEGGRYTINDVHYVAEGDSLVPAGETEFARDSAFGFRASNLKEWVEEKTRGRVKASDVVSISIDDIRQGGPQRVTERLVELSGGRVCFVNAASMRDLEVFVLGLIEAEKQGKKFLFRTAASFVRARSGQSSHPLLAKKDMVASDEGGALVVVGSHVPRTTGQLQALLAQPGS
ncbi:MAG: four-carbon acid sugar kinase family protein, partial [Ardenticatenaceae bacterium]